MEFGQVFFSLAMEASDPTMRHFYDLAGAAAMATYLNKMAVTLRYTLYTLGLACSSMLRALSPPVAAPTFKALSTSANSTQNDG